MKKIIFGSGQFLTVMSLMLLVSVMGAEHFKDSASPQFITPAEAAVNPFKKLAGSWRGSGYLAPYGGARERVRCRVRYTVSGANVTQTIRCAGTDYRINASNHFSVKGSKVSGSWSESNYGHSGWASGRAGKRSINMNIGGSFSGKINVYIKSGRSHSVVITAFTGGSAKRVASIALRR